MSDDNMVEPISAETFRAAGNAARFGALSALNTLFAGSGLSIPKVARRAGWSDRRVARTLAGRNKLTLRSMGILAWAMDGAVWKFSAVPRETDDAALASPPLQVHGE